MGQEHFQFMVLLFGLTSAPQVFAKLMTVVAAYLWRSGVPVFPHFDDWLLKAGSPRAVVTHLQTTANLLHSLGFIINVPKSHLIPSQMLPFIAAFLDTVQSCAYPSEGRVQDILAMVPMFQSRSWISVRLTLRLLGLMASCILLVTHTRWYMQAR